MKKLLGMLMLCASILPVKAATNDAFMQMLADTGCESKCSDQKKDDLFKANYKNKPMTVTGEIVAVNNKNVSLKMLPKTQTADVIISFTDPNAGYDLEKGQRITITFDVLGASGCIIGALGVHGVVLK